ncbi:VWA domain-containing protein [Iamia majanohamensis]|uniref:VWA domain-containing protein n=1 Tax=Iamia majanohamensis TaxID=467976 RepID=A0AAE9Y544_9ACTN|nr:VWA domain-containing protein [Iamia majanohamensis]WCO66525.1 VWA domain-containing protein [Iamia majanohamensis]
MAALAHALRRHDVAVAVRSAVACAEAVAALGAATRADLYWAGRATLVHRPEDIAAYDAAFAAVVDEAVTWSAPSRPSPTALLVDAAADGDDDAVPDQAHDDPAAVLRQSAHEALRHADLGTCSVEERAELHRAIARLRVGVATRRSRRRRPARGGDELDLGATVTAALATGGEPLVLHRRAPSVRPRRLVLLVDVSGSMEPYARALLRFAHAAVASRGAGRVEAFTLGTRLTRITRALTTRDPDLALERAAGEVADWSGGTRLGDALALFVDRWGARGLARGAVVVVLSDGWDRGDPEAVAEAMARLHRVAHHVVWVNPLKAAPGYEPLARGMAAALPHVDTFVTGHSLASLEDLAALLATLGTADRPARRSAA